MISLLTFALCLDLGALSSIESCNRDDARGAHGERGRYQMTRRAWSEVTREPFANAHRADRATVNAEKYLELCRARFQASTGRQPTDRELWLCWNLGVSGSIRSKHYSPATLRGFEVFK